MESHDKIKIKNGFKLIKALTKKDTVLAVKLIDNASLTVKLKNKCTALYIASCRGFYDICRKLIDSGANVNVVGCYGYTPLHVACFHGHLNICRLLIEAGADVNAKSCSGNTPFSMTCKYGKLNICRLLIEAGADVRVIGYSDLTQFKLELHRKNKEAYKIIFGTKKSL